MFACRVALVVVIVVLVEKYKLPVKSCKTCYNAKYYYFYQNTDGATLAISKLYMLYTKKMDVYSTITTYNTN